MAYFNAYTDKTVLDKYMRLDIGTTKKSQCMYVWIDGTGVTMRAKTRTMDFIPQKPSDLPIWEVCGDACAGLAHGYIADIYLNPVAMFRDPFRPGDNKIVLCDTYSNKKEPTKTNFRKAAAETMEAVRNLEPWFGIEQEYTLLTQEGRPFGWPANGYPGAQGPYYCGIGANKVYGRDVVEAHYRACLYAGIKLAGTNAEVMPGEWEYQVGPCEGITMGDELWASRFILHRVAEDFGLVVSLDPKQIPGDWNGAGAHCNFSTKAMRSAGGIAEIDKAVDKLSKCHLRHIEAYDPNQGRDNQRRLTGLHETSKFDEFTVGVADRGASIRVKREFREKGCGYLEDRRPASNCDPYRVTKMLVQTCCLD